MLTNTVFILLLTIYFAYAFPGLTSLEHDISLHLFTRNNTDIPIKLTRNTSITLENSVLITVHGWMDNDDSLWIRDMRDAYLKKYDANFISIDWKTYAYWEYALTVHETKRVGKYVGDTLSSLFLADKIKNLQDVYIVGHGLGAHLAGFIGKKVKENTLGLLVGRITGLDPARPLFEMPFLVKDSERLSKHDAMFVDVLHTSGGFSGMEAAIGHADFYPNGGVNQPGCSFITSDLCSYYRAYILYMESMNSTDFVSTNCESWRHYKQNGCVNPFKVPMGFLTDTTVIGRFYLYTNGIKPYARGDI